MSLWTDAHCHLQERYLRDWQAPGEASDALRRAREAGVGRVVVIGTDATSSREALAVTELSGEVDIYATVGLHPHEATSDVNEVISLVDEGHPRLVGIGECGLDYYYEHSPRPDQRRAFVRQLHAAREHDLALVVHARDAFEDLFDIFDSEGVPPRTVIHCFTGTPNDVLGCLERGCDISIAGVVTFKNADALRDAVREVPLERLHVETDAPFLAPVPHRGRPNEPAWVSVVGEYVAHLRGLEVETLREITSRNSARLFNVPEL